MMTKSDNTFSFAVGYEAQALQQGVKVCAMVRLDKVPHLLLVAPSGSGKTYLLVLILRQLSCRIGTLILADFKGMDFRSLDGCRNYYKHERVADALKLVFEEMQARMEQPQDFFPPIYLVIDEWSGFLGLYSKKEQDEYKKKLASILMLGRGISIFVILALQRADANYLTGRDNFGNVVGLGTLSRESVQMVFSDFKEQIAPKGRGQGYLKTDGRPLKEIVVPHIRDYQRSLQIIKTALDKPATELEK